MVVRGRGAPIVVSETVTLGESEYLPDKSEIRHVVTRSEEGEVGWTTEPIGRYAHRECVKTGAEAVLSTIESRFGSPIRHITTRPRFDDDGDSGEGIVVENTVCKDTWEQTVKSTQNVDFDDLVAETPRTVQTTVELVGEECSCDVPIFLRRSEAALL